eukprot:TRINITY_DN11160_c0_g1_i1.p1 TRINITY_DN11160_c0_g1~~TRINITY_DN11160_c0_g1_i1.p1  ORF type:complete len:336 (+),score=88.26 TRINITY_DN11160_c0_g1_i1:54-1010(+)
MADYLESAEAASNAKVPPAQKRRSNRGSPAADACAKRTKTPPETRQRAGSGAAAAEADHVPVKTEDVRRGLRWLLLSAALIATCAAVAASWPSGEHRLSLRELERAAQIRTHELPSLQEYSASLQAMRWLFNAYEVVFETASQQWTDVTGSEAFTLADKLEADGFEDAALLLRTFVRRQSSFHTMDSGEAAKMTRTALWVKPTEEGKHTLVLVTASMKQELTREQLLQALWKAMAAGVVSAGWASFSGLPAWSSTMVGAAATSAYTAVSAAVSVYDQPINADILDSFMDHVLVENNHVHFLEDGRAEIASASQCSSCQ